MIRLALRVQRAHAEVVLAELLELAPSGVEEVALGEGIVEYAVYGAPGELPSLPDLRAAAGGALVEVSTSELPDDWSERWRAFHKPVFIAAPQPRGGGEPAPPVLATLRIRPPWEPALDAPRVMSAAGTAAWIEEIVIDPAQAFGTGAHHTTRLCLELLLELAAQPSRGALIDLGAGSGVLAIAAARLGFAPVLALDNDPLSATAARENASANSVALEVRDFDLRSETLPWLNASTAASTAASARPVLLANLLAPLLLELARALPCAPRELIAGGLLREEAGEIAGEFARRHSMRERERRESGEWAALRLTAG